MRRSAWNAVMCTMEAEVIKELEYIVHKTTSATVAMPSYDGLLLQHKAGALAMIPLTRAWREPCMAKWEYHFPISRKDFEEDLPKWIPILMQS